MADSVYYHLERMLPELDDLKQRGLFSASEIKEIARKRREFEFRLERRAKVKEDYLRYVEYELQLEKLRKLRKKALIRSLSSTGNDKDTKKDTKKKKKKWQKSLSDRASAMRIMLIYERVVTRFKGDLELWMQYLDYCRSQGTRRMQKVLTKALRLHPTVPGLWIYAAAWQFETNANITAARALMQRGLRMCPQSELLWLEYFRMELVFAERLKVQNTAGLKNLASRRSGDENTVEDEESILEMHEGEIVGEDDVASKNLKIDELELKLARTIYRNAIAAIPSSLKFRQRFMELLPNTSCFNGLSGLRDEILSSLAKDFSADAACWDWHARVQFEATGLKDKAVEVYENALNIIPSADMYEYYTKFLEDVLLSKCQELQENSNLLDNPDKESYAIAIALLELFKRANESRVVSPYLAEHHVTLLLRLRKVDAARNLLEELLSGSLKDCPRLWALGIMLEMKRDMITELKLGKIADFIECSLQWIPLTEGKDIWHMVLEYFSGQSSFYDRIVDMLIHKLAASGTENTDAELACSLIDWILHGQGVDQMRKVYRKILTLPGSSLEFCKHCINLESWMVAVGCKDALQQMRSVFKYAVDKYSQDAKLWLEYCFQEIKSGNLDAAGDIYWRAKKTLDDPSLFIEGHQRLISKEQ